MDIHIYRPVDSLAKKPHSSWNESLHVMYGDLKKMRSFDFDVALVNAG